MADNAKTSKQYYIVLLPNGIRKKFSTALAITPRSLRKDIKRALSGHGDKKAKTTTFDALMVIFIFKVFSTACMRFFFNFIFLFRYGCSILINIYSYFVLG